MRSAPGRRSPATSQTRRARAVAAGLAVSVVAALATVAGAPPAHAKNYGASKTEWRLLSSTGPYGQPFPLNVYVIDDSTSCDLPPYPYGCNTPTGTVYFYVDGAAGYAVSAPVDPFDVDFSTATASLSWLAPGQHTIRARYIGGVSSVSNPRPFEESEATTTITITKAKVAGSLSSNVNPSQPGQAVTFSMTVAPNPAVDTAGGAVLPTGSVQFVDITGGANDILATKALSAGAASHTVSDLPVGTRKIAGVYLGDSNYEARAIGEVSQVVSKASPSLDLWSSDHNLLGAPVQGVAQILGGASPTGTVTFRLYSDAGCTAEVFTADRPVASKFAISGWFTPPAPGTYRWTARYNGDTANNPASSVCGAAGTSVTIRPFAPPPVTRTVTGDTAGPLTVKAGESVLLDRARVSGSVTVEPGGALNAVGAQISGGISAERPAFFSLCGTSVSTRSAGPSVSVAEAGVPVRLGDPAAGCAGNTLIGTVSLSSNLALAAKANTVSGSLWVSLNGPGNTILAANTVTGTLSCSGNTPVPVNLGQPNSAGARTGQCATPV